MEAWHVEFDEAKRANLFVDIVFSVAKMGGDGAAPVKFTVRLKRAEIVVLMPVMGEFKVDPSTIARLLPGELTLQRTKTLVKEAHAAGEMSLGPTGMSGNVSAGAKASMSQTDTVNSSELMRAILAQHGKTGTLADAILDRLVHNAHRLRLTGESMRKAAARNSSLDLSAQA